MVSFSLAAIISAGLIATASASGGGPIILIPGPDNGWVTRHDNVLAWDCANSNVQDFTVVISNKDPNVLSGPLAIIAMQDNKDCSKLVTSQQSTFPAASGYTILFTNPLNQSEIYSKSGEFEVEAEA